MRVQAGGLSIESALELELDKAAVEARLFGEKGDPVRLGRFEVKRRLGRGATSVVYEAYDPERECTVALKLLRVPDPSGVYRLKREFRSLAEISHPNLVALYELFHEREHWFFSMELVDGVALDAWLRPECGDLDQGRLRSAFGQLAQAVSAIHAAGKLHCDLKPSNVLVTRQDRVVVLDFGLVSELVTAESAASHTGLVGTPAYIAPECAAGSAPTPLADWYAFGVMLFEVLVGRRPFEGDPLHVLSVKQREDAPDPGELCSERVPDELCRLCAGMLSREPGQRPAPDAVLAALGRQGMHSPRPASGAQASSTAPAGPAVPFVGREAELQQLRAALDACRAGGTAVVLVGGPSGVGKSALLERFVAEIDADVLVLRGRCHEQESLPHKVFDPIVSSLGDYLHRLPAARAKALIPRYVQSLLRLFPELGRVDAFRIEPPPKHVAADVRELRAQAFAALKELLLRLTDQVTVVVIVDDLQWGDLDSARMMEHVLGSPEPPPLLFAGAYRNDEAQSSEFVRELLKKQVLGSAWQQQVLELGPLPHPRAVELARELLRGAALSLDERTAAELAAEAEGMPFFLGELVAHLKVRGAKLTAAVPDRPATLEQVILARVRTLPAPAQALVQVLSAAAGPLEQTVALEAAGLSAGDPSALQALRTAHLLRTRGGRPGDMAETYHDRVRELVVRSLSADVLRALHARIVAALERHGVIDPERLMVHHAAAGDRERAAETAVHAAHAAATKLAFNHAAELFGKAIALTSREQARALELHEHLAAALANAGRGAQAAEAYLEAAAAAEPQRARQLRRLAAQQFMRSGRMQEGTALARELFREVGLRYPETTTDALIHYAWNNLQLKWSRYDYRRARDTETPAAARERLATLDAIYREVVVVDFVRGAALQAQFLRRAQQANDVQRIMEGLAWKVWNTAMTRRNPRPALRELERVEQLARITGTPYAIATAHNARAGCALLLGRMAEVVEPAETADRIFRESCPGSYWEQTLAAIHRYGAIEHVGNFRSIIQEAPQRAREALERDDRFSAAFLTIFAGFSTLVEDRVEDTRSFLEKQRSYLTPPYGSFHLWVAFRSLHMLLYAGEAAAATRLLDAELAEFNASACARGVYYRLTLTYLVGRCCLAQAKEDARSRGALLRRAEGCAQYLMKLPHPHSHALGMLIHAEAALRGGRDEQAHDWLRACAEGSKTHQAPMFACYAERALGVLVGGAAGAEIVCRSDLQLRQEGVRAPERWARFWVDMER